MGISGLLPLLKSVHKPTHLSELAGKTIAIDAKIHDKKASKGILLEGLAKYIDYAMHRVRLLQYHKITPYVVFDGGPLPAKKGTEVERKRKRDENFALAATLAQQGNHGQAREHYVKCVDITPQMAFQLIKALRAENIPYVVAPYEADAQLYHLERTGLVHGVLTEDSDLLIFGTQLLLLKLDAGTATCTAITSSTLASNSSADLPLYGWGIKELRECAMLSGCDYIEGVRGVGLKTAAKLLRRWGTVDKALRALRMDGKAVERDWEARMRKAEVGFLNQRVWDPCKGEIVYLTEPDWATWDEEREKFVGGYIEAELAGRLARGDVDPITLEPMIDIMPSFQPTKHAPRLHPLASKDPNRRADEVPPAQRSLFQYFAKQPKTAMPVAAAASPVLPLPRRHTMQVGRASGKRTLAEQYDREATPKRSKVTDENVDVHVAHSSKFFASAPTSLSASALSRPARVQHAFDDDKEDLEELEIDEVDIALEPVLLPEEDVDMVVQEDGYISPGPAFSSPGRGGTTPDFSSPLETRVQGKRSYEAAACQKTPQRPPVPKGVEAGAEEDDADAKWGSDDGRITSPPMGSEKKPTTKTRLTMVTMMHDGSLKEVDDNTPGRAVEVYASDTPPQEDLHVDLRDIFANPSASGSSDLDGTAQSRSPVTPADHTQMDCAIVLAGSSDIIEDDVEAEAQVEAQVEARLKLVGKGWEQKYSNTQGRTRRVQAVEASKENGKGKEKAQPRPALRRRETMATPLHTGQDWRAALLTHTTPQLKSKPRHSDHLPPTMTRQKWTTPLLPAPDPQTGAEDIDDGSGSDSAGASSQQAVVDDAGTAARARTKLRAFRFR